MMAYGVGFRVQNIRIKDYAFEIQVQGLWSLWIWSFVGLRDETSVFVQ